MSQTAATPASAPHHSRRFTLAAGLLLVLMAVAAYQPAFHGGFIWDDNDHISENITLRSLEGLKDIWFKPGATCQYYPLTFTGFWVGYQLWGLNPFGYHFLNVLMHGLVAVLLWQVLVRLKMRGAWLAGAIFVLHPVCVMSVAWMTELKNTLSAALALAAGWAWLRFAGLGTYESNDRKDWRFYALCLVLFQAGLFAKTAVSFLPASLFLITWWRREQLRWRDVWPLVPMLGMVGAMGWLTFHIEHLHGATGQQFTMGFVERLLVSGRAFWFYLGKLFLPVQLTFIYERWAVNARNAAQYLYPLATLALLAGLWCTRRRFGKGSLVAMGHFYVCTSLLALLVVLYMTRYSFVSDHWQYFGCMSVIALVAFGITAGFDRFAAVPMLKPVVCGLLLLGLGVLTWRQCRMYANLETLWQTTLARNPRAFLAHNNLGEILGQRGEITDAAIHFQAALQAQPTFAEAHYNFANILVQQERRLDAIAHFRRTIELQPDFAEAHNNLANVLLEIGRMDEAAAHLNTALKLQPVFPEAHYSLAKVFLQQRRVDDAIASFRRAVEIRPGFAAAHYDLGSVLIRIGKASEAIVHFQKAAELRPGYAETHGDLGWAFLEAGQADNAIACLQKALSLDPGLNQARVNLALAFVSKGRADNAVVEFRKCLEQQPNDASTTAELAWLLAVWPDSSIRNGAHAIEAARRANQLAGAQPEMLRALAAAYAEAGRFAEAITTAQQATQLAADPKQRDLAGRLRQDIELYQAGSPVRDTNRVFLISR